MPTPNTDRRGRDGEGGATYLNKGEAGVTYPPERTAVLVIDPVNDFLSEGGAAWDMTENTVRMHDVVGHLEKLLSGARERGVLVLYGPMAYTEEDYTRDGLHRRSAINRVMYEKKMFIAGSWGADFHPELVPEEGDIVLLPHKGIDVFETDLPDQLQSRGITHLVIAGMTANLCCESTGRHAMEEGYDVTFISNAIGAENIAAYEASVHVNYPIIGNAVLDVDEFLAAIGPSTGDRIPAQVGDKVRASDRIEIGEVEEVVEGTEEHEPHLLVPRGLIFEKDTYIPLDAVVRRVNGELFINVPRLSVHHMPWDKPPTRADREKKQGPKAREVEKLYRSRQPDVHEGRSPRPT
jgi:ureidoacrylate peracid hydrolase